LLRTRDTRIQLHTGSVLDTWHEEQNGSSSVTNTEMNIAPENTDANTYVKKRQKAGMHTACKNRAT